MTHPKQYCSSGLAVLVAICKRKSKQKVPKISSFFQRQDTVSDLDWNGKYYPTHLLEARSDKQENLLISVCPSVRHKKLLLPLDFHNYWSKNL